MRKELLNFDWHTYNLSDTDLDFTIELIDRIITDRDKQIKQIVKKIKLKSKKSKSLYKDDSGEGVSDIMYYSYIDAQYLWHFGIWRIQAIFEGILSQKISSSNRLFGLKSKLDHLKALNITIANADYEELLNWAKLRNALSHLPPEQFRPGILERSDVIEYSNLVERVTKEILAQHQANDC